MPHLVHDHREQVDMAGGRFRRIRLQLRRREGVHELRIVERRVIDEPAVTGRIAIDRDMIGLVHAKPRTGQVGNADG